MNGLDGAADGAGAAAMVVGGCRVKDLIPKFDGSTNLATWADQVRRGRRFFKLDDEQAAAVLPAFLAHQAYDVYAQMPEGDKDSADKIMTRMQGSVRPGRVLGRRGIYHTKMAEGRARGCVLNRTPKISRASGYP